jgi:hypothetical protein
MGFIKELGIGGSIGLLVGIALVSWVEPTTAGGIGLLLIVGTLVGMIVGGIWTGVRKSREKKGTE